MTDADLREAVARAMYTSRSTPHEASWERQNDWTQAQFRAFADAAIALVVARCARAIGNLHDPADDGWDEALEVARSAVLALAPQEPSHD